MHWAGGVYPSMHWAGGVYPSMHWAGPPNNDRNSDPNNNNPRTLKSYIQEIPGITRKTAQAVKSTITKNQL